MPIVVVSEEDAQASTDHKNVVRCRVVGRIDDVLDLWCQFQKVCHVVAIKCLDGVLIARITGRTPPVHADAGQILAAAGVVAGADKPRAPRQRRRRERIQVEERVASCPAARLQ